MIMTAKTHASVLRLVLGSLLIAILGATHWNFLFMANGTGIGFILMAVLAYYLAKKKETKSLVKHFQYRTASILSFLLPVSAMIFSFVFTGTAIQSTANEAEQAGAAIGGAIGGTFVVVIMFVIGLSLGIVFYLLSRKGKS